MLQDLINMVNHFKINYKRMGLLLIKSYLVEILGKIQNLQWQKIQEKQY